MTEPRKRQGKPPGWLRWGRTHSFIGDDDSTDNPNFDKGSWLAFALVLMILAAGILMMLALAGRL